MPLLTVRRGLFHRSVLIKLETVNVFKTFTKFFLMFGVFTTACWIPSTPCSPQLPIFPPLDEYSLFGPLSSYAVSIHCVFSPSPSYFVGNALTEFHEAIAQRTGCIIPRVNESSQGLLRVLPSRIFSFHYRGCFLWERMLRADYLPGSKSWVEVALRLH